MLSYVRPSATGEHSPGLNLHEKMINTSYILIFLEICELVRYIDLEDFNCATQKRSTSRRYSIRGGGGGGGGGGIILQQKVENFGNMSSLCNVRHTATS